MRPAEHKLRWPSGQVDGLRGGLAQALENGRRHAGAGEGSLNAKGGGPARGQVPFVDKILGELSIEDVGVSATFKRRQLLLFFRLEGELSGFEQGNCDSLSNLAAGDLALKQNGVIITQDPQNDIILRIVLDRKSVV